MSINFNLILKAKALYIIKSLSKKEKKQFKDYLNCGYFTKNRSLTNLYNLLLLNLKNVENDNFTEEQLYEKVFGKSIYNYNSLKNLLSELNKHAETFITINRIMADNLEMNKVLNDELIHRNLFSSLNSNYSKSIKQLDSQGKRNYLYYYYKFHFDSAMLRSIYSSKPESFVYQEKLNSVLDSFSKWLCLNTFEFYQGVLGLKATHDFDLDEKNRNFFEVISEYTGRSFPSDELAKTYLYYYEITSGDTSNYFEYRKSLLSSLDKFDFWEQRAFLIVACNHTIDKIEEGENKYYDDFHEYMGLMIARKFVCTITGYLSENAFTLSIKNYCNQGKIPEAEKFFNKHKEELVPELKESVQNLCRATILYHKKEYRKALTSLSKIKHEYYALTFQANNLNLIILYETGFLDNIEVTINSSLKYISSNKDAALFLRDHYKSFILLFNKVLKLKLGETNDIFTVKMEINKTIRCHFKSWLLEKTEELEHQALRH